jgi:hypothetical protein
VVFLSLGVRDNKRIGTLPFFYHHHKQPTAGHIGLSNFSPSRSIFGYSYPAPASRPEQIVTLPGLRASYTTFTETRSPLYDLITPAVVGSTADMVSPLPLQHAYMVCNVGDFSSLPDHLVSDSIPQRNPEPEPNPSFYRCRKR